MISAVFLLGCGLLREPSGAQSSIVPSCSIKRQESLIPNSHVWILTAEVKGFPKRAKLSYSWSTPRNYGKITGVGKEVQFDATGVPSLDVLLTVDGGGTSASCYQPI
jgi:hypothetical protein